MVSITRRQPGKPQQLLAQLRSGHVLITSRIANWRTGVEALELHVLAQADAVAFLLERTPHRRRSDEDDAARPRSHMSLVAWRWLWSKRGPISTSYA